MIQNVLMVAVGGALGAVSRFGLSAWVDSRLAGRFPAGTLCVNVLGCLLLGALMTAAGEGQSVSPRARLFLGTGLLGAFTTFSTFGVETLALVRDGRTPAALASVGLNLLVGLVAAATGGALVRQLVS